MCALILWWILSSLLTTELYLANSAPSAYFELWASSEYEGELGVFDYAGAQSVVFSGGAAARGFGDGASGASGARLGGDIERETRRGDSGVARGYCDAGSSFDTVLQSDGESLDFENIQCKYVAREEATVVGESHALFVTAERDVFVARRESENAFDACDHASFVSIGMEQFCENTAETTFRTQFGSCFCERVVSKFIAGAEHLTFSASHAFESRFQSGPTIPDVTHVRVSGNEEETLATFGRGEDVKIPVAKLLEWLDVDLDEKKDGEASRRVTGVRVEASFDYYNFHQAPGLEERVSLDEGPRVCVVTLELAEEREAGAEKKAEERVEEREPELGSAASRGGRWFNGPIRFFETKNEPRRADVAKAGAATFTRAGVASGAVGTKRGHTSRVDEETVIHLASRPDGSSAYVLRSQNGVRVSVNSGGVISRLDAALILETFVQAFLLLSFSNILMRFVAYNLLGTKSRVYKEFGEHEVQYEREYARFAVQSIVASHAFERLDADNSGTISEEELVDALRRAQGPNGQSDEDDLRALAAYIVACGDVDGSQAGDGEADGLISATEWFDLFGSGHADSASIRENLRSLGVTEIAMLRRALSTEEEKAAKKSLFFSKSLKRGLATAGLFAPEVAGMEQAPEEEGKAGYGSADASKP